MKRSKLIILTVTILVLVNLATLAFVLFSKTARHENFGRPPRGEGPKQIIIDRLGYDAAQQKAYQITIDAHRRNSRKLEQASRALHQQLFSLLKEPEYMKKSDSLMNLIALNQKAIDHVNFNHFLEIKALCKKDQLEKFNLLADDLAALFAHNGPPK
ncbi:hypothetical protein CNR22_20475 [Sphingobacteriaceae bacterium]|nr:hypothetical protein CNR22_20475 [Sphingobacteriaceae bacterium]